MKCGTWCKLTESTSNLNTVVIKYQVTITIALINLGMLSPSFSFTLQLLYGVPSVFLFAFSLSQHLVLRLTLGKNSEGPRLGIVEYGFFFERISMEHRC